jgi:predicted permease
MPDWRRRLESALADLDVPPERMRDLVEELSQDLEERFRSARSSGASEQEAAARAWSGLGSVEELRERLQALEGWERGEQEAREMPPGAGGGASWLGGLAQDLRLAVRSLRRSPGFVGIALLTLALGIGANVAIFSVVNALFFAPLPGTDPERLVAVYTSDYSGPLHGSSSYPDFEDLRDQEGLFRSVAAYTFDALALQTDRVPSRVWGELVTGRYFETLQLPMTLGRPLGTADDDAAAAGAVVISHGSWQRRFAGAPDILGRTVKLSGETFTVVGVAPEGFTGMTRGIAAEAWVTLAMRARLVPGSDYATSRGSRFLSLVGRLPDGSSVADVQARLDVIASGLRGEYPDDWTDRNGQTRRLSAVSEREARVAPGVFAPVAGFSALLVLVVAAVLLIACANVASLFLARATARRREMAVRLSLGASRGRLVRLLLAESMLVAALGGAAGMALAAWAGAAIRTLSLPLPVPVHLEVLVDLRVLAFAVLLTAGTGLLVGIAPALQASGPDTLPALKDEGSGLATGRTGRRMRRAFVVVQVALSMVLLVGASLLLRGLTRAVRLSPGFSALDARLIPVDLGLAGYDVGQATALIEGLAERAPLPGVDAFALTVTLPVELHAGRRAIEIEGHVWPQGEDREIYFGVVGPGHFDALGIPILGGREFTTADRADSPGVLIVNETFARRFWPGRDPIGRTVEMWDRELRVVGLAKDSKYRRLAEEPMPFYYLPITQDYGFVERFARLFPLHVVLRGDGEPASMAGAASAALREIDPDLPAYPPKDIEEHLGFAALPSRVASLLFAGFGLLGLFLAGLGLYGVVAYSMTRRVQEIGLRMALGASRADVLGLGIRDGVELAGGGVLIGMLLAAGLAQGLRSLLHGLSPLDPVTYVTVPLLLVAVALGASALPARRASRIDPIDALRYE